jgi:iron complex transport system ATP-binding protein
VSDVVNMRDVVLRRDGKTILRRVSWRIRRGEHWTFSGPNGSGKTVTLKVLTGYLWPTEGAVEVLGHRFGEYDLRKLRRSIGWVSMDLQYQLQRPFSVLEVVLSGRAATIGLYEEPDPGLLERARGLLDFFDCEGLEQRRFHTLSYGEQKRVMIARALITDPALLILDEPCTGLDLASRERFLQSLQKLGGREDGPTIILVTHHIEEVMPFVTHCHLIREGVTLTQGRKEELMTGRMLGETLGLEVEVTRRDGRYWSRLRG